MFLLSVSGLSQYTGVQVCYSANVFLLLICYMLLNGIDYIKCFDLGKKEERGNLLFVGLVYVVNSLWKFKLENVGKLKNATNILLDKY